MRLYSCGQAWENWLDDGFEPASAEWLAELRKQSCDRMTPGIGSQEAGVLIQVVIWKQACLLCAVHSATKFY